MSLLALKQYLSTHPMAGEDTLRQVLGCDAEWVHTFLTYWRRKGNIVALEQASLSDQSVACLGCAQRCRKKPTFYRWQPSTACVET